MLSGPPARTLAGLGVRPSHTAVLKDVPLENASWLVDTPDGARLVLRRYHDWTSQEDLAYEHAVLRHLAGAGGSNGGACVEVARDLSDVVAARDSKDPDGPRLTFSPGDWRTFTARIKAGQLGLG
jgi:Domain of unknown function (DUF397)/Phosphotransferase enzyme family